MAPAKPDLLELAFYLRRLREEWAAGTGLTQAALARALGGDKPLAPATVASWENRTTPKLPPRDRILAYAQFFATRRSIQKTPPSLVPLESFSEEEQAEYERLHRELLTLHSAATGPEREPEETFARRTWRFADAGPLTIICARLPGNAMSKMAKPDDPNYTELLSFADLDAMVELHGHVRAENPAMDVYFRTAEEVTRDDLTGHLVIIGGVGHNPIAQRFLGGFSELASLPVTQREDNDIDPYGEFFIATIDGQEKQYEARWMGPGFSELLEDVGLLVRMANPLNPSRTLTLCNGIHSRGVLGAVRSLTDSRLRGSNEIYIGQHLSRDNFGILMRVRVIDNQAMPPDFSSAGTILHQWSAGD